MMPAERVLATQQARDAANQLVTLTGTVKERIGKVLQQGGILADPTRWEGSHARQWRNDWGPAANHLRTTAAKLDELRHAAKKVIEDIFSADAPPGAALVAAAGATTDPSLIPPEPPRNGTPSQNAVWWNSLSPTAQAAVLREHPDWLGNLNGVPGNVRSQANMARLPGERARLMEQLNQLREQANRDMRIPFGTPIVLDDLKQIDDVKDKLASLDAIDTTMAKGDRQLLTLDTSGRRVKAVVAVGDVDTAEHVAVFVPGFTSTVDGSLRGYDSEMFQLRQRAQAVSDRFGDHGQVAAVTWIGYEAPQWGEVLDPSHSVASDSAAKVGAAALDGFLNGIGASHDAQNHPLHLTALGHSYGSLTTGIALQQQTPVHDAVVFGSPGMDISNAHDLAIQDGHVYSMWADGDFVPLLNVFGSSPYDLNGIDRMNTREATSADGQHLESVHGHTEYLRDKSTSQYNMAVIVASRPDFRIEMPSGPPNPNPDVHTIPPGVPPSPTLQPAPSPIPAPPGAVPSPPPLPR